MFECGARFNNEYYIKVSINPLDGKDNTVTVEQIVDGKTIVATGTVTLTAAKAAKREKK